MPSVEHVRLEPGDLVAVAIPQGSAWLDLAAEIWSGGAAVLPVDRRLPRASAEAFIARARPTAIVGERGLRRLEGDPVDPETGAVVPSSGTAGPPRLVVLGRRALEAAVEASAERLGATPEDRWLCCLPLGYVGGLMVLLRGVLLGAPVAVHPRFGPGAVDAEPDLAFVSLVPTMLVRLLDHGADLARCSAILVGGAPLPHELRERAERAGARLVETYGLAESCGGVVYDGTPLPGTRVRVDAAGAIELRGPTLMTGYRFDPEGSASAFTSDGWLRTGDVGHLDGAGRLRVLGRGDDLIVTGGEKVWPEEVEAVLGRHPRVRAVAVAGRPDAEWGDRVTAWVVPADPDDPPTLEELRGFGAASLPRHGLPRELVLVDSLPTTAAGKVRRAALRRD